MFELPKDGRAVLVAAEMGMGPCIDHSDNHHILFESV